MSLEIVQIKLSIWIHHKTKINDSYNVTIGNK